MFIRSMTEGGKQKVVVIGHGYTSRLGVIRALGRAGYEVIVIVMVVNKKWGKPDFTPPIDSYSKFASKVYYCMPDAEQLITLLLDKCTDKDRKVVLFPDSDVSAAAIDLNQKRLENDFLFPHIVHTPGAVVEWMSKIRQKQGAEKVGLNVAGGEVIEIVDGVYEIPSTICYPCFSKPLESIAGAKTGVGRCDNELQLRAALDKIIKRSPTISVLVEEYKEIEEEYALLGISDGANVHIPGILHVLSLAQGGHYGVAKQGEILPNEGYESLIDGFKSFVKETRFVGLFDIDFYKSEGRFYFCEINFRYGGSGYAYTKSGVNLPAMCVRVLNGERVESGALVTKKAKYVNERMCLDDWYNGFISTQTFSRLSQDCDISFIKDPEDSEPQRMFKKMIHGMCVRRIIKRCVGR